MLKRECGALISDVRGPGTTRSRANPIDYHNANVLSVSHVKPNDISVFVITVFNLMKEEMIHRKFSFPLKTAAKPQG